MAQAQIQAQEEHTHEVNSKSTADTKQFSTPAITAAFLVVFDVRKGYTISWQKSTKNIKLDGVVEFKSLPSGLHNVEEDLVYFVHDEYVGISAFLRQDDSEAARNARMLSVGVLVPLEAGRMGKSWLHAPALKQLVRAQQEHLNDYDELEEYWNEHKLPEDAAHSSEESQEEGYRRPRALSTVEVDPDTHTLPSHHPALALPDLLESFGPLLFPVLRMALLQKRILILGEAPVESTCNYVYNISILASIPKSLASVVPIDDQSQLRLRPLFNVGISDIDALSSMHAGWIACTTDDVLCSKPQLFDLLVILPTSDSSGMQKYGNKRYPKLIASTPELAKAYPKKGIRATQRDAKRYQALRNRINGLSSSSSVPITSHDSQGTPDGDSQSLRSTVSSIADKFEAVEPLGWTLMAYNSLVWWISSGDRKSGLSAADELEDEQDRSLLQDSLREEGVTKEVAMVAYFHRLSVLMFSALSQAVKRATTHHERYRDDPENEQNNNQETQALLPNREEDEEDIVDVAEDDIRSMGLDVWSDTDKQFIAEMVRVWWNRKATVTGGYIECCGLRIP